MIDINELTHDTKKPFANYIITDRSILEGLKERGVVKDVVMLDPDNVVLPRHFAMADTIFIDNPEPDVRADIIKFHILRRTKYMRYLISPDSDEDAIIYAFGENYYNYPYMPFYISDIWYTTVSKPDKFFVNTEKKWYMRLDRKLHEGFLNFETRTVTSIGFFNADLEYPEELLKFSHAD